MQKDVMPSCGSHFHCPPAVEVPLDFPEVQRGPLPGALIFFNRRVPATHRWFPVEHCDEIFEMPNRPYRDARHQTSLSLLACGNDGFIESVPGSREQGGKDSRDPAQSAVQSQFTEAHVALRCFQRHFADSRKDSRGDG